jgi:hypothetical protein
MYYIYGSVRAAATLEYKHLCKLVLASAKWCYCSIIVHAMDASQLSNWGEPELSLQRLNRRHDRLTTAYRNGEYRRRHER